MSPTDRAVGPLAGSAAMLLALAVMAGLRTTVGFQTLPELVWDTIIFLIPPAVFSVLLDALRFDAKPLLVLGTGRNWAPTTLQNPLSAFSWTTWTNNVVSNRNWAVWSRRSRYGRNRSITAVWTQSTDSRWRDWTARHLRPNSVDAE